MPFLCVFGDVDLQNFGRLVNSVAILGDSRYACTYYLIFSLPFSFSYLVFLADLLAFSTSSMYISPVYIENNNAVLSPSPKKHRASRQFFK
eukprot:m.326342 g.326342  ORF g.326342 m.326342 type:complete len:91 (-) comp16021_c0_seq5:3291-3563(-)